MVEPNEHSQKIATLSKGAELKLLSIENEWYKISSGSTIGYVKAESTTNINENKSQENQANGQVLGKSKEQLNTRIKFWNGFKQAKWTNLRAI